MKKEFSTTTHFNFTHGLKQELDGVSWLFALNGSTELTCVNPSVLCSQPAVRVFGESIGENGTLITSLRSELPHGRSEASPVSEKPKPTSTKCDRLSALSVKEIQDRTKRLDNPEKNNRIVSHSHFTSRALNGVARFACTKALQLLLACSTMTIKGKHSQYISFYQYAKHFGLFLKRLKVNYGDRLTSLIFHMFALSTIPPLNRSTKDIVDGGITASNINLLDLLFNMKGECKKCR